MAATNRYIDGLEPVIGFSGYTGGDLVTSPRARDFRAPFFIYLYYLTIRPVVSGPNPWKCGKLRKNEPPPHGRKKLRRP
jgi:hypothetical protein